MDQGVIRLMKAKYCKNMVQKFIKSLQKNNALPEVSILKAMQMLVSAWNAVFTETIANCFRKAGISTGNQETTIADEDDPFKDLQNETDALRNLKPDLVPEDVNAATLTDVDAEVFKVQPLLIDSELLAEFFKTGNTSDGDEKVINVSDGLEEEPIECPGKSDLLLALETLQKSSLFSTNGKAVQADCLKIKRNIDKHFTKNKKQTAIKDFLKL